MEQAMAMHKKTAGKNVAATPEGNAPKKNSVQAEPPPGNSDNTETLPPGWRAAAAPAYRAYRQWFGKPPGEAFRIVIEGLLQPRGAPHGARLPRAATTPKARTSPQAGTSPETRLYNGYTPQQIAQGIEDLAISGHHSPASLIKHIAGLLPTPGSSTRPGSRPSNGGYRNSAGRNQSGAGNSANGGSSANGGNRTPGEFDDARAREYQRMQYRQHITAVDAGANNNGTSNTGRENADE